MSGSVSVAAMPLGATEPAAPAAVDSIGMGLQLAVVSETYPPEVNGVARTVDALVQGMRARGVGVQVIRPRQTKEDGVRRSRREEAGLAPIEELLSGSIPLPGYRGLRMGLAMGGQLRKEWLDKRPDAIYIATEGPLGRSALNVARALDIPVVSGFHTAFDCYARYYGVGFLEPLVRAYLRRFHNRTRNTIVATESLRESLTDKGFENVVTSCRGVDSKRFHPRFRRRALRSSWGVGDADLVVLYVGRLAVEKNLALVQESFAAISAQQPSARLVWVGDGPALEDLRNDDNDSGNQVFAGFKSGVELASYYASADLFLFPSLTETWGNVVLEAMASGVAPLGFDYAATREMVIHDINGWRVPCDDSQAFVQQAVIAAQSMQRLVEVGGAARASASKQGREAMLEQFFQTMFKR